MEEGGVFLQYNSNNEYDIRYFLLISKEETATEQCKTLHILLNKIFTGRVEERLEEFLLWTYTVIMFHSSDQSV